MPRRLASVLCLLAFALLVGCSDRNDELDEEEKQLRAERGALQSQIDQKIRREAELTEAERAEGGRMGLRLHEIDDRLNGIAIERLDNDNP